jgi:sugar porter (SP) family MFS transporter
MTRQASSWNTYLLRSAIVAAFGGLLFGFDTAVIAGTTRALTAEYGLSPAMLGVTVSIALWGTVLGSIFAGPPADRYGRRGALGVLGILYVATALGCGFAWSWGALLFFRFIGGLAIGASSVVGPIYIAEISPAAQRGRLVAAFQLNIVLGILVAYLSNWFVAMAVTGPTEWRWKLGIAAVPAAAFLLALSGIPQSPRWLITRGENGEAVQILRRMGASDPETEVRQIADAIAADRGSAREPLFQRRYRKPVILAFLIGMFNQFSGINAILYYLNDIFEHAGFSSISSDMQAVLIGFTNLVFTLIAMTQIDRLGRRKLLLTGAAGTALCLAGVAAIFASGTHADMLVWLLVVFIAFFAFSQGTVIWVYLSEVFPNRVRAKGQSLGSFTHWIMNAILSVTFPIVAARSGAIPFIFFAAMTALQFLVVLMFFPETKGVSLEEMAARIEA